MVCLIKARADKHNSLEMHGPLNIPHHVLLPSPIEQEGSNFDFQRHMKSQPKFISE